MKLVMTAFQVVQTSHSLASSLSRRYWKICTRISTGSLSMRLEDKGSCERVQNGKWKEEIGWVFQLFPPFFLLFSLLHSLVLWGEKMASMCSPMFAGFLGGRVGWPRCWGISRIVVVWGCFLGFRGKQCLSNITRKITSNTMETGPRSK